MNDSKASSTEASLLRVVVDTVPVGIVLVDAAGEFQFVNAAAQRMLGGVTGRGATGTAFGPAGGYTLERPDHVAFPSRELPLVRALERGESVDDVEILLHRVDGTEALLLVSARPTADGANGPRGAVAMLVDVTARQRAEIERARTKDEFLATVSHEL